MQPCANRMRVTGHFLIIVSSMPVPLPPAHQLACSGHVDLPLLGQPFNSYRSRKTPLRSRVVRGHFPLLSCMDGRVSATDYTTYWQGLWQGGLQPGQVGKHGFLAQLSACILDSATRNPMQRLMQSNLSYVAVTHFMKITWIGWGTELFASHACPQ